MQTNKKVYHFMEMMLSKQIITSLIIIDAKSYIYVSFVYK